MCAESTVLCTRPCTKTASAIWPFVEVSCSLKEIINRMMMHPVPGMHYIILIIHVGNFCRLSFDAQCEDWYWFKTKIYTCCYIYSIPLPNPSSLHTTVASLTENLPSSSETGRNVVSTLHTSTSPSFTDAPPRRGTGVRRTLLSWVQAVKQVARQWLYKV